MTTRRDARPTWISVAVILVVIVVLAGGAYWFLNRDGGGSDEPPSSPDAQTAAAEGLATLRLLVTDANYRGLGLDSVDQVAAMALGDPLPVYRIQLDQLIGFKQGDDPSKLLIDDRRVTYPVVVDARVVSSLSVGEGPDGWRATDFGSANVVKALSLVRQDTTDVIVQIPSLKLYFIGSRRDNVLFLTPATDNPRFGFEAGTAISAESAILAVQPFAAEYNGLPQ